MRPYEPPRKKNSTPRILVVSYGHSKDTKNTILGAYVDSKGRLAEHTSFVNFKEPPTQTQFRNFILRTVPDIILVSGIDNSARRLMDQINQLVEDFINMEREAYPLGRPPVDFGEDDTAHIFMDSNRAVSELPNISREVRYCVGVARRHQNPLFEYGILDISDIKALTWHPTQNLVSEDKLIHHLERALVNAVNEAGLDLNLCLRDPYWAKLLPYICGLGPRKATNMIRRINTVLGGAVDKRISLAAEILSLNVLTNCVGFLKISSKDATEILDRTRIHPEDYDLARKMAADALDYEQDTTDLERASDHVRHLIENDETDRLNELNLDDYAEVLQQQLGIPRRYLLEQIMKELQNPWDEIRNEYEPMTSDEIFNKLTGENEERFHSGIVINGRVEKIYPNYVLFTLENGIDGMLDAASIDEDSNNLSSIFRPMEMRELAVLSVQRERFFAELSARTEDIQEYKKNMKWRNTDVYFDRDTAQQDEEQKSQRDDREKRRAKQFRTIRHPNFQNFTYQQAISYLKSKPAGMFVIRPSSKGTDKLCLTWRVDDKIFHHLGNFILLILLEIQEIGKINDCTLGRELRVGSNSYADLDDFIVNHVEELRKRIALMKNNPRFHNHTSLQHLRISFNTNEL